MIFGSPLWVSGGSPVLPRRSHETHRLSDGRVDAVEAAWSHEDVNSLDAVEAAWSHEDVTFKINEDAAARTGR